MADAEMKVDLLRILPQQIRELLLWHSSNIGLGYQQFRDTVCAQTASILIERGHRRPVQAVGEPDDSWGQDRPHVRRKVQ